MRVQQWLTSIFDLTSNVTYYCTPLHTATHRSRFKVNEGLPHHDKASTAKAASDSSRRDTSGGFHETGSTNRSPPGNGPSCSLHPDCRNCPRTACNLCGHSHSAWTILQDDSPILAQSP